MVATPLSGAQGFTLKTDRPPFDTVQARRLGVPPARLVLRHVLPGAAVPGVQELARSGDQLLGGVLVIEAVFAIAGTATALVEAVQNLGVPTVQALTLTLAAVACLLNLVADLVSRRPAPRTEVLRWRRDAPGATGARRAARCCRPCRVRPPSSARS
ncbi:ABC transporter permease subunit [Streptomyces sp. PSAA01]|uniref:ABC transporter permease subunit n=1 Tax=Streptomyces sp. PSAA01 TaxID=2912762 RepID=UPI0027E3041A|nr:ABC transporter permease subunit [Streptomyces sp. PSAA01]